MLTHPLPQVVLTVSKRGTSYAAAGGTSTQHAEQRVAASGMGVRQYGQSLVFAGGGGAARRRFTDLTMRKMTSAMIRKLMMSLKNLPYAITGKPFN
jgi:hypothetical protein